MREIVKIHGIGLDKAGRCTHYHTELDVAALLCGKCRKYYACYECHDQMEDHSFEATSEAEPWPVLCGCCRNKLSREEYKTGSCPYCHAQFNPGCSLHENIYFCKQKNSAALSPATGSLAIKQHCFYLLFSVRRLFQMQISTAVLPGNHWTSVFPGLRSFS